MILKCKCGHVGEPEIRPNGIHQTGYCKECGSYVGHVKSALVEVAVFYFGKYKGMPISECTDLDYLRWAMKENLFNGSVKEAVANQIEKLTKNNL